MKLNQFIKIARKEKGFSLVAFANEAGITYSMLYRLEDGSIVDPHPEILKKIAEPLSIDYKYLMDLAGYLPNSEVPLISKEIEKEKVPVISWTSIKEVAYYTGEFPSAITDKWLFCESKGFRTFGVVLTSNDFAPFFCKDNVFIVSEEKKYKSGDFVLTYHKETGASLKRYRIFDEKPWIISINENDAPSEQKLTMYSGIQIVGKVIEQRYS